MRAPLFWSEKDSLLSRSLLPLAALYAAIGRCTRAKETHRLSVPIICVGNLVAGGAGKTPVALALAKRLAETGKHVHLLSRGYGGKASVATSVDPTRHSAREVGDEALLLAELFPSWVSRDRVAGARAAVAAGAELILMDDGYQNMALHKDISLLVVDGAYGFGNERLIPAGPLREPVESGLARATAIILVGEDVKGIIARIPAHIPLFRAHMEPGEASRKELLGKRVVAFAGIGRPEKFFATVRSLGANLVQMVSFGDHHRYTHRELSRLREDATAQEALLVTTAKDAVRLPQEWREQLHVVTIEMMFEEEARLIEWLNQGLSR